MMTFNTEKIALSKTILDTISPKPKTLVELGCYVGCSAIAWGSLLKDYGVTDAKVYTCELEPKFAKITRDFVDLAGLSGIVEVVEGKSTDSIQRLTDEGKLVKGGLDVLFLDHWEAFYQTDLMLCEDLGLFRKGSMILADNTDMPGAPDYLEYVRKGGRGGEGGVKLETKTHLAETEGNKPVSFLFLLHCLGVQSVCGLKLIVLRRKLLKPQRLLLCRKVIFPCHSMGFNILYIERKKSKLASRVRLRPH
jgi:catechol O-methyltransferase